MSKTIELPDPLFAEIDGYAHRLSTTPEELLAMVRSLKGSITLPEDASDKSLITEARTEKHGPL
jgi:hypothetical protein